MVSPALAKFIWAGSTRRGRFRRMCPIWPILEVGSISARIGPDSGKFVRIRMSFAGLWPSFEAIVVWSESRDKCSEEAPRSPKRPVAGPQEVHGRPADASDGAPAQGPRSAPAWGSEAGARGARLSPSGSGLLRRAARPLRPLGPELERFLIAAPEAASPQLRRARCAENAGSAGPPLHGHTRHALSVGSAVSRVGLWGVQGPHLTQ